MLTLRSIALPEFNYDDSVWTQFYEIFRDTLNPGLVKREFKSYYFSRKPVNIDLSFIYEDDNLIGFICASFYHYTFKLSGKRYTVARGAAGILPGNRGHKMPSLKLCSKYMRYKFQHPFEKVYITGYMANPKVYAMMCKYAHRVYPKVGIPETNFIKRLRDELLHFNHREGEYLVRLPFKVVVEDCESESILKSKNEHIRNYIKINPRYGRELGLVTIIPLDWGNILSSIRKGYIEKSINRWRRKVNGKI